MMAPPERSTEGRQAIVPVCDMPSAAAGGPRSAVATARAGAKSDGMPTTAIRHALRALASETGPQTGLRGVKLLRPLVARAHEVLRERTRSCASALRRAAQSIPTCAVGRVSRTARWSGCSTLPRYPPGCVATTWSLRSPRLRSAATGGGNLAPGSDLDLLFLLPVSSQSLPRGDAAAPARCGDAA